jgi:hypothetical protein
VLRNIGFAMELGIGKLPETIAMLSSVLAVGYLLKFARGRGFYRFPADFSPGGYYRNPVIFRG